MGENLLRLLDPDSSPSVEIIDIPEKTFNDSDTENKKDSLIIVTKHENAKAEINSDSVKIFDESTIIQDKSGNYDFSKRILEECFAKSSINKQTKIEDHLPKEKETKSSDFDSNWGKNKTKRVRKNNKQKEENENFEDVKPPSKRKIIKRNDSLIEQEIPHKLLKLEEKNSIKLKQNIPEKKVKKKKLINQIQMVNKESLRISEKNDTEMLGYLPKDKSNEIPEKKSKESTKNEKKRGNSQNLLKNQKKFSFWLSKSEETPENSLDVIKLKRNGSKIGTKRIRKKNEVDFEIEKKTRTKKNDVSQKNNAIRTRQSTKENQFKNSISSMENDPYRFNLKKNNIKEKSKTVPPILKVNNYWFNCQDPKNKHNMKNPIIIPDDNFYENQK